ncbi:flagellar biosynthetic protein FliR [Mangrovibacter yixingensis]|uniref:flagellar biosynthetic protein FliR n=1 Tax=Mangrovibacter yixingensis TaxID=1529639 RepID=UPI001CFA40D9|nr:flagellar biosynthetic protein FliR [Mangrovibacter yixingensis]
MVEVTSLQWAEWLNLYFWPLLRIMALIATAPVLSERAIPRQVKLGLGLIITVVVAPLLPPFPMIPIFSPEGLWTALQQTMIGIAMGFTMQIAFAAIRAAGEIVGLQMGLSFATFLDPSSNLSMPVLARFMEMLALLLFLTWNGHLWMISLLVDSFHTLPIGPSLINADVFMSLARAGSLIFINGVMLALPLITLLLTVNLALGLLNRMTPQLSIFVIGFPITLTTGMVIIAVLMPLIAPFAERLFADLFNLLSEIISNIGVTTPS